MTPELAILMGLPGAGKSTFYRERLAATHRHVSKDLLQNAKNKQARQDALNTAVAPNPSMSYICTSTDVSTVPWSCHCQLVSSAGA